MAGITYLASIALLTAYADIAVIGRPQRRYWRQEQLFICLPDKALHYSALISKMFTVLEAVPHTAYIAADPMGKVI